MAETDLLNAFNECIDQIIAGQSVEDCLRRYPQHAPRLRPMLETGQVVRRTRINPQEVNQVQERIRQRVAQAAQTSSYRYPIQRLATLAASLLIVLFVTIGGSLALAQSSLPGDPLYGVKRLSETVQLRLGNEDTALRREFDTRRVHEIQQLLALKRAADIEFKGQVETISGSIWTIAGLTMQVQTAAAIEPGDTIEVVGYTTTEGELIARAIRVLEHKEAEPLPTITPVPTRSLTATPSPTAIPSLTLSPSPTPTLTLTATPTASLTPSPTFTITPTPISTVTLTPSATDCVSQPPTGWELYTIAAGDTLSALAAARGIALDEVMRINCLTNARLIITGQSLYLPPGPPPARFTLVPTQPIGLTATSPSATNGSDDNSSSGNYNPPDTSENDNTDDEHDDHGGNGDDNQNDNSDDDNND